jgi:nicotinamidase-related amidase
MTWDPRQLDPEWPYDEFATDCRLDPTVTALLVIDMQYDQLVIAPDAPLRSRYPQLVQYWERRIEDTVVPNIQRLIALFRAIPQKIVYTRNGTVTTTGDEMTARLKTKLSPRGACSHCHSPGYQIISRLAPTNADLVVDKLTSGAFTASFLDHGLRNMGIRDVIITGVLTDACVFGTARAAAELGYQTLICEDACATLTQRAHDEALLMHARIFGRVATTEEIRNELRALSVAQAKE